MIPLPVIYDILETCRAHRVPVESIYRRRRSHSASRARAEIIARLRRRGRTEDQIEAWVGLQRRVM